MSAVALGALPSCASYPKMRDGAPLEVNRGYWVHATSFEQGGREVDRKHVKETLGRYEDSAHSVELASAYERVAGGLSGAGGALIGFAIVRQAFHDDGLPYFMAGGMGLWLSVGFAFAADDKYADAVEGYNKRIRARPGGPPLPPDPRAASGAHSGLQQRTQLTLNVDPLDQHPARTPLSRACRAKPAERD